MSRWWPNVVVNDDIPFNLLGIEEKPVESFCVELRLLNSKLLVNCPYKPHKNSIGTHFDRISESVDLFFSNYEKMIFWKILLLQMMNIIRNLLANYGLKNLIRQPTCCKNPGSPGNPIILTHIPRSFQSTCVVETGLFDFHLMVLAVMRKNFKKYQPKVMNHKSYKRFF